MAANKLSATILIFSLLFFSTFSNACDICNLYPPPMAPTEYPFCPRDTLKLGACIDLLGGIANLVVGTPPSGEFCCPLLEGLADLEAAACLCTTIKANILGLINLEIPIAFSLLISACSKSIPPGFLCE